MAAITVIDGPLYQWDTDRKVRIIQDLEEEIELVHFSNGKIVKTKPDGDNVIAPIPNILLQVAKPFTVYAITTSGGGVRTVTSRKIPVEAKEKPDDYVYTETEVMSWQALEERIRTFTEEVQTAYDIVVKYGYEGTEEEWIAELQGNAAESARLASEAQAKAAQAQANAAQSEKNAAASATNAKTSEQNASAAATNAGNSEQNAIAAANSATEAARQAGLSCQGIAQAEQNAGRFAAGAEQSAQNAAASAGIAAQSEQNAQTSEKNAAGYKTAAENARNDAVNAGKDAKTSADNAATSERNAKTSETNAGSFASNAKASEDKAKASETSAAASAAEAKQAAASAGGIKTINGVAPDANGNVQVETSAQADWNAPDGAPGHVKNRTHWVEKGKEYLLEETDAVESRDQTFGKAWLIREAPLLTAGETYTVIYNGVPYDCVCYPGESAGTNNAVINSGFVLGNFSAVGGENTGEPFAMVVSPTNQMVMTLDLTGATSVRIGIMGGEVEITHKLAPKFLPDGVPYSEGGGMVEILPDFTMASEEDIAKIPALGLVEGNTYVVKLNGTEYTCVAWEMTEDGITTVCLGDAYTASGGQVGTAPTGEPFVLAEFPSEIAAQYGRNVMVMPLSEDITLPLTFSIYGGGETVHKLDNKFLDLDWLPIMKQAKVEIQGNNITPTLQEPGNYDFTLNAPLTIEIGDECVVVMNGIEFAAKAFNPNALGVGSAFSVIIANPEWDMTTMAGITFMAMIAHNSTSGVIQLYGSGIGTLTAIAILANGKTPNKMPEKFLPEGFNGSFIVNFTTELDTVYGRIICYPDKPYDEVYNVIQKKDKTVCAYVDTTVAGGNSVLVLPLSQFNTDGMLVFERLTVETQTKELSAHELVWGAEQNAELYGLELSAVKSTLP